MLVVAVTAYVVGTLLLGTDERRRRRRRPASPGTHALDPRSWSLRTLLALGYAMLCMLGVAAIALFLSTVTDSPLGAALGALAVLIASTLLLTLDAADAVQPYLPTRYWLALVDLFRDPILWRDIVRGRRCSRRCTWWCSSPPAWANFTTKDITG